MKLNNDLKGDISTYMRRTTYSDEMQHYLENDKVTEVRILLEKYIDELYDSLCETLGSDMDVQEHNNKTQKISEANCLYSSLIETINKNLDVEKIRVSRETAR